MSIEAALRALRSGLIVGIPTDTVYGVAVDPADPVAVRTLFELKGRGEHLPLAVLVASLDQAEDLVHLTRQTRNLVGKFWPGAFTAILRGKVELAEGVGDHRRGTLAVRMPDHPKLRDLIKRSGPLAVTSANRSGSPPAIDSSAAREALGDGVAVYVEGRCHGGQASTVVDLTLDPPAVLRRGPIHWS
jgi:tRNA threonylcarbamoyl adenosine modification protein (Sua5/YciO/YrdC/YwlC family)